MFSSNRRYALDCGIDWDFNLLTKERCEQIHWFAKSLYEDDAKNAAVLIYYRKCDISNYVNTWKNVIVARLGNE